MVTLVISVFVIALEDQYKHKNIQNNSISSGLVISPHTSHFQMGAAMLGQCNAIVFKMFSGRKAALCCHVLFHVPNSISNAQQIVRLNYDAISNNFIKENTVLTIFRQLSIYSSSILNLLLIDLE